YLGDTRPTTAPHEFGHMLGLMDEYQVTTQHYEGITGQEAPEGDYLGGGGTIDEVAGTMRANIGDAASAIPADVYKVVTDYGLRHGTYAHAIADAYKQEWGTDIITDLVAVQNLCATDTDK